MPDIQVSKSLVPTLLVGYILDFATTLQVPYLIDFSTTSVPNPDPPEPLCFLASQIRIHQSEVWIRILLSSCKNNKKNLESYYFVTLFDFLSLKNNVNVPSKSKKLKKLCYNISFLLASCEGHDEKSRIWIHNKMSWIRNTGYYSIGTFQTLLLLYR